MKKLLATLLLIPTLAFAWEPTKPVTVIVGNTPGAGNEIAFRKLAEIVNKKNPKFHYVMSNIPGADSVVANNKFAEDLLVFLTAYRPANTDIKVFARIHNSDDPEAFDDKDWTMLEPSF